MYKNPNPSIPLVCTELQPERPCCVPCCDEPPSHNHMHRVDNGPQWANSKSIAFFFCFVHGGRLCFPFATAVGVRTCSIGAQRHANVHVVSCVALGRSAAINDAARRQEVTLTSGRTDTDRQTVSSASLFCGTLEPNASAFGVRSSTRTTSLKAEKQVCTRATVTSLRTISQTDRQCQTKLSSSWHA